MLLEELLEPVMLTDEGDDEEEDAEGDEEEDTEGEEEAEEAV